VVNVYPRHRHIPDELLTLYRKVSPSTIGHLTDRGFMLGLEPLSRPTKLVGRAVTVRIPHLDSAAVHIAVDLLLPDDVLVISMSGDVQRACFGGVVGFATMLRQGAGAVIDGAVTDVSELRATNLSIFSRGVSALTTRSLGIEGEVNVPIAIAGAVVEPGDLVLGDENGVMVIPMVHLEEWGATALDKEAREPRTKERLTAGEALKDISGAGRYAIYLDHADPPPPTA